MMEQGNAFLLQNHVDAFDAPKSDIINTDVADAGSDFGQQKPLAASSEDVKKQKRYSKQISFFKYLFGPETITIFLTDMKHYATV